MKRVYSAIDNLIAYAKEKLLLEEKNVHYIRNGIFRLLNINGCEESGQASYQNKTVTELLDEFSKACINNGVFDDERAQYYCDGVMGELSLSPYETESIFYKILNAEGSKAATEWFYNYSVNCDYVKKSKLDSNPRFTSNGLIVTINKAKPEFRDPKKAASGNSVVGGYPQCTICHENEGFTAREKRTLRTIDITLGGEKWFWQFSPYGYFYQHGIAVNYKHTPMCVNEKTFIRLMDFVDIFPHYFIGCNAPLPRIGGSVLAHDHYQGGAEVLPMHTAKALFTLTNKNYPHTIVEIPDWNGTVIRVVSFNREEICSVCESIRQKWINYNNEKLNIINRTQNGEHNAISPTVVKTERGYEMSIILRNNVTSEEYPDGVFHAHPEYHIIKKESIGLIEAQGLFILPGRLESQLKEIENILLSGTKLTDDLCEFNGIYDRIKDCCNGNFMRDNVQNSIKRVLGEICGEILQNTAVFKNVNITVKFIEELGFAK